MKKTALAIVVVLFLASTMFAVAQPPRDARFGNPMKERREQIKDALKLTDQQETQIQKLRMELERKQTQVHSKIQIARLDMKETLMSDNPDRSALEKALKQVSDLQHQLKMNHVDFWFSVKGILTADQQKEWRKHLGGLMKEGGKNPGGRMRGRGPMGCRCPLGCGESVMPGPPDEIGPR